MQQQGQAVTDDTISVLMDGELQDYEAQQVIAGVKGREEVLATWDAYHLIGDTLRLTPLLSADFNARISARLALEPTVLAPVKSHPPKPVMWAWSAAASVAAVAVVGWVALKSPSGPSPDNLSPNPAVVVAKAQPPQNRPDVNEYLQAHQEFSANLIAAQGAYQRASFDTQADVAR
jgi:sigma-E factor negative regulatory protein RseA